MVPTLTDPGARAIPEFDGVPDVWPRGERLRAVREAAAAYKLGFQEQGQVRAVRSVKEKILADLCRADPRWLQIIPSTELVPWRRFWPVVPTFTHGGIGYGAIRGSR